MQRPSARRGPAQRTGRVAADEPPRSEHRQPLASLGSGTAPVVAGLVVGLAGAIGLTRFIQSMLFETSPIDVLSLSAVSAIFLTVAMAACFVPAWRAAPLNPMSALRQE